VTSGPLSTNYDGFPSGFFDRRDPSDDIDFYDSPRLVTHIDHVAIAMVGDLYIELGLSGSGAGHQLDLMSSWISHLPESPDQLTVLGMNQAELDRNPQATERVVLDLNSTQLLPFADNTFDGTMCCVSVDYLIRPIEVFAEVARVLKPNRPFVCTFSNRCFPTKAIQGWVQNDDVTHGSIVAEYFRRSEGFHEPIVQRRQPPPNLARQARDPLFGVWAFSK
jgi:SAM-dependent methyltransferase